MEKTSNVNKWMIRNLFWIIPLFFVTMIAGFIHAMIQRDNNDMEIILNTEKIQQEIKADTTVLPKIDFNKKNGYQFGDIRETISSALGKNERDETLTKTGGLLVFILNKIDKNHCKKSIIEL